MINILQGNSVESDIKECLDPNGSILAQNFFRKPIDIKLIGNLIKKYERNPNFIESIIICNKKKSILIVENNESDMLVLITTFHNTEYILYTVSTGLEALHILEEKIDEICLIIANCAATICKGYEIAKKIKEYYISIDKQRIPMLAIIYFTNDENKKFCQAAGFNDVLIKPIDNNVLLNYVNYYI